jgi:GT2 family glycosyltransferase
VGLVRLPAASAPRLSILVVTASRPERLLRCLAAVARKAPASVPLEVVLVLNGASEEVRDTVSREVEGARVVSSDVALGFAGGLNLGSEHASGELLHLLHDDTEVSPGWLEPLVDLVDGEERVGAAGSALLNLDGTLQSAGWMLWRDGTTGSPWVEPPDVEELGSEPFRVDYCPSASLVVRRDVWEAMGGADEELHPAYYVDVDLALSVRRQGLDVVCVPSSRVRHGKGRVTRFRTFVAERNHRRFAAKWEDELARQPPRATDENGLAEARDGAARRRATAAPARTARTDERTRRERALVRDLELKNAYVAQLERDVDALTGELATIEAGWVRRAHRRASAAAHALRRIGRRRQP